MSRASSSVDGKNVGNSIPLANLSLTCIWTCVLSPLANSPVDATTDGMAEVLIKVLGPDTRYCFPQDPVVP